MGGVKAVDEMYHISEVTISVASYTVRTAVAAANAVVNSRQQLLFLVYFFE